MNMSKRLTAILLALVLTAAVFSDIPISSARAEEARVVFDEFFYSDVSPSFGNNVYIPKSIAAPSESQGSVPLLDPNTDPNKQLLRGGMIRLTNSRQLLAVGSGLPVTDADLDADAFGSGDPVFDADGCAVVYSAEASYFIENDIPLEGADFRLPEGFSGSFLGLPKAGGANVYDAATDTIYLGNPMQLAAIASADRAELPVITGDLSADTFGLGRFIFPNGENEGYLTYSADHNYSVSTLFTIASVQSPSSPLQTRAGGFNSAHVDGRDFFGQVSVDIAGTQYILIGNRAQLDAINSASRTHVTEVCGPVYKVVQTRTYTLGQGDEENWTTVSSVVEYPGDADLIAGIELGDGTTADFSGKPLYGDPDTNVGHLVSTQTYDYHDLDQDPTVVTAATLSRTVYCAVGSDGEPDPSKHSNNDNNVSLTYEKNGNYIVFRDIDMFSTQWNPLMFTGTMYGVKGAKLWDDGKTTMLLDTSSKPVIYNINVNAVPLSDDATKLDLNVQTGVGFFGTLTGNINGSNLVGTKCIVKNIKLYNGTVTNTTLRAGISETVVNGLLTFLAGLLGLLLDPVLSGLLGKTITLRDTLEGLLNTRAGDPTSLATGAFAGRVVGNVSIEDCEVENISVSAVKTWYEDKNSNGAEDENDGKIVGLGCFVGHAEGVTSYDLVSLGLDGVVDGLAALLNVIPGLGLGDLINVLFENTLPIGKLIPTGYTSPGFTDCTVNNCSLSQNEGKYGVGGFAGSLSGAVVKDCTVKNCDLTVKAHHFGGGFAGVARDAIIVGTLSGLGIDVLAQLHPQTELIDCLLKDNRLTVTGGTFIGGFTGVLANSYGINDSVESDFDMTVTGTRDYVGGFTGYAKLGTGSAAGLGDYLETSESLLSTVKDVATGLLGTGGDQSLLDLGGIANSAVLGFKLDAPIEISATGGSYAGGIVGRGEGFLVSRSSEMNLRSLAKYKRKNTNNEYITDLPIAASETRDNHVLRLKSVYARRDYAGGIAGYLTTANVGGLLGDSLGLAEFLGFEVSYTYIDGINDTDGYTVRTGDDYAAGGIGWAVGGDVKYVELTKLGSVSANNRAGGFVGSTGPGDLANGGGLDLTLLGISLLKANNLLSLISGLRTTYLAANVTGVTAGFTVTETGRKSGSIADFVAGGYVGNANSVRFVDCHAQNILSVTANMYDGAAGGFVAYSATGNAASLVDDAHTDNGTNLIALDKLLDAAPTLVPSYDGCFASFVSGGWVEGDKAGGFTGEFMSGKVNTYTMKETVISGTTYTGYDPINETTYTYTYGTGANPWSVYNIHHVRGGEYAGGWGGHVYPGALAKAGGGLSLLGAVDTSSALNVSDLLGLADAFIPIINYAGVYSDDPLYHGFTVWAAHDETNGASPAVSGYAGGFIGRGQSVQISYSHVNKLKHGAVTEPNSLTGADSAAYGIIGIMPDPLESQNGSNYMVFNDSPDEVPYAVAGAYFAGGYIGLMDVGSTASIGDKLNLLGTNVDLSDLLSLLEAVVSTVEHSDVYGAPGGFNVIASPKINQHNGVFDDNGVSYAGGFAGKISGGHIQDSNVSNFAYIIGEVAAGGYVGEMISGSVSNVVENASLLTSVLATTSLGSLASLVSDFVPTIRNSETTCIPCGGAVRAEKASDPANLRGMAGGYVGHSVGGQIWGSSNAVWKTQDPYSPPAGRENRECRAIRIRSVYGAEYAGGYCGLVEAGSQASVGGLSVLAGLLTAANTLSAVEATYPTISHAYVNGPLRDITEEMWNQWKAYVGDYGAFGSELMSATYADLAKFIYGTHVVAGRHDYDLNTLTRISGCAGGFVGAMHAGVIRNSEAVDAKLVLGMRAAGGFAGEMQTGNLANLGGISALDIAVNLGNVVDSLGSFMVPAVYDSGTAAYKQGLTVGAYGDSSKPDVGTAGGYVGGAFGAQLDNVWVRLLKLVKGTHSIGGFVGKGSSAALLTASTSEAGDADGLLQKVLDWLLENANNFSKFADVLEATILTIKDAEVTSVDDAWGFVVDGEYNDGGVKYARHAGGFAGLLESTVIDKRDDTSVRTTVSKLRGVNGGHYAGGFVGLASVGSVASVGGDHTNVLNLLNVGNVGLLDIFRTYIYNAELHGVDDGICVYAHDWEVLGGNLQDKRLSGAAGGFAGGLMSATTFNCSVDKLNFIEAKNFAGGFFGHGGKKGVLDVSGLQVDNSSVLGTLLNAIGLDLTTSLQLLDCVGSTVKHCTAEGFDDGFIVKTTYTQDAATLHVEDRFVMGSCAGGFAGFADLTHIEDLETQNCTVTKLKKVVSPQIAGGFVGRTSVAYLADLNLSTELVNAVSWLLNILLKALLVDDLSQLGLINVNLLGIEVDVLSSGKVARLNLFGLEISVAVAATDASGNPQTVNVIIGSTNLTLPVIQDMSGEYVVDSTAINLNLIQVNRTDVKKAHVTGVPYGYDVFGGGADQDSNGANAMGYAGGFVGYNNNGWFSDNVMELCDTVRGTAGLVGPFSGAVTAKAGSYTEDYFEANNNTYYIYRAYDAAYDHAEKSDSSTFASAADYTEPDSGEHYNRYEVEHFEEISSGNYLMRYFNELENANEAGSGTKALDAYRESGAMAVLMLNTRQGENTPGDTTSPDERKDPCEEKVDITINKIWEDNNDAANKRPTEFEVRILAVDYGTSKPDKLIEVGYPMLPIINEYVITLTKADNSDTWSNTWKYTEKDLPIAFNDGGTIHYIKYYVYEPSVIEHYTAHYTVIQETATVNITNLYHVIPDTGGKGTTVFMLTGALLIAAGCALAVCIMPKKERRKKRSGANS